MSLLPFFSLLSQHSVERENKTENQSVTCGLLKSEAKREIGENRKIEKKEKTGGGRRGG